MSISVVIPTLGRVEPLRECLAALAACDPQPDEILVVDQSRSPAVEQLVAAVQGARVVPCDGRGVSRGRNDGLRAARNELVCITDDDCRVSPDWIGEASKLAALHPGAIVTGRVVPRGDPRGTPSTKDDPDPADLSDKRSGGWMFPNNVVLPRAAVLALGGFDELFGPEEAAEDNEFCYRWLKNGGGLFYEPAMVVEHDDWRTPDQLEGLYVRYARGEGFFYAKHLRSGDLRMLWFLARAAVWAVRSLLSAALRKRPAWTDSRRGLLRGLPGGFRDGWRAYGQRV